LRLITLKQLNLLIKLRLLFLAQLIGTAFQNNYQAYTYITCFNDEFLQCVLHTVTWEEIKRPPNSLKRPPSIIKGVQWWTFNDLTVFKR
jgi:hypothetical protein